VTPTFFTDRDLGKQFPAILRTAGFSVERHADHFRPETPDDEWLQTVATRGWVIITHDQRIRYKVNERDAVMRSGASMLVMIGKAPFPELGHAMANTMNRVLRFLDETPAPFIAKVYRAAPRELARDPQAPGHVALWLSANDWRAGSG
jgi:hypothetical protein